MLNGDQHRMAELPVLISQDEIKEIIRGVIREELQEALPEIVQEATAKPILTIEEVSRLTGYSKRHLQYLRDNYKDELPYSKHGKKITYKRSDVMAFLKKNYVRARK